MGLLLDFWRDAMGILWYSNGLSIGFPRDFYGISMVFLWEFSEIPMGFPWYFFWISLIFLWDYYGISMGFLWHSYGSSMMFQWYFHGIIYSAWDFWGFTPKGSKRHPTQSNVKIAETSARAIYAKIPLVFGDNIQKLERGETNKKSWDFEGPGIGPAQLVFWSDNKKVKPSNGILIFQMLSKGCQFQNQFDQPGTSQQEQTVLRSFRGASISGRRDQSIKEGDSSVSGFQCFSRRMCIFLGSECTRRPGFCGRARLFFFLIKCAQSVSVLLVRRLFACLCLAFPSSCQSAPGLRPSFSDGWSCTGPVPEFDSKSSKSKTKSCSPMIRIVCFPAWPWKFPTSPLFAEINSVIVSLKPSMCGPAVLLSALSLENG